MNSLKSEHLQFIPIKEGDHLYLFNLWNDKALIKFTFHPYMATIEDCKLRVTKVIQHYLVNGCGAGPYLLFHGNTFIGYCGIDKLPQTLNEFEIFYIIDKNYQNKGYATEVSKALTALAFDQLRAKRVCAEVVKENKASIKVLENTGMKMEALLNNKFIAEDGTHDLLIYSIIKNY